MIYCAQPVSAQDTNKYVFSLSPEFGFFYGQAEEVVYPPPGYKGELLSQLLWDMKPVFYYGLNLDYSQARPMAQWGFFADLSLKKGIPGKSGNMEDRDWDANDYRIGYSTHDNVSESLFMLDASVGLSFPLTRILLLRAYINVSYLSLSFFGKNGYGIYAWNPSFKDYSGEKVINYTQEWLHIAPAVSLRAYFFERFFTELSLAISPLVWCVAEDQHLERDIQFKDDTRFGILFQPELRFSFIANQWLEFSLGCSWRYISRTRGESYYRSPIGEGNYIQDGEAGTGLSVFDTGLGVKVRFQRGE